MSVDPGNQHSVREEVERNLEKEQQNMFYPTQHNTTENNMRNEVETVGEKELGFWCQVGEGLGEGKWIWETRVGLNNCFVSSSAGGFWRSVQKVTQFVSVCESVCILVQGRKEDLPTRGSCFRVLGNQPLPPFRYNSRFSRFSFHLHNVFSAFSA